MKNKFLVIIIIIFIIVITVIFFKKEESGQTSSVSSPPPSTIPTPQTFKFDSSTDLQKELESISPEVLESDFE